MNKATLKKLGGLCKAIDVVFEEWVVSKYQSQEAQLKLTLLKKIKKQLEEQKRGFIKSRIDYSAIADYLIENYATMPYGTLLEGVSKLTYKKTNKKT